MEFLRTVEELKQYRAHIDSSFSKSYDRIYKSQQQKNIEYVREAEAKHVSLLQDDTFKGIDFLELENFAQNSTKNAFEIKNAPEESKAPKESPKESIAPKNASEESITPKEAQSRVAFESVGLVPTMGALHNGHKSLIMESRKRDFCTIVSIFVNPTQFGAGEDFASYPRTLDSDLQVCKEAGVSAVFAPSVETLYADIQNASQSRLDEVGLLPPKSMGYVLEGFDRPTHFSGVLQVVLKLFNLARPTRAYFGKKDAQQVLIIQKMVRDFFLPLEIVPCPIVRDFDGLALSSRNIYLSQSEREIALCIPRTIGLLQEKIVQGVHNISTLENIARENLKATHIFYAKFFDRNLRRLESLQKDNSIFLLSVRVGSTRLLDNFWY